MHERTNARRLQWQLGLWLWWILACAVGGVIIGALEEGGHQFFATLVLTGPVLGSAQGLVLQRYIQPIAQWILASMLGWWLGTIISIMLSGVLDPLARQLWYRFGLWESFWLLLVNEPVTLAFFGAAQWVVLKRHLDQAGWWALVSVFGGAVKGAVSQAVGVAVSQVAVGQVVGVAMVGVTVSAMDYGSGWAGYGVVTGVLLVRLLQNH